MAERGTAMPRSVRGGRGLGRRPKYRSASVRSRTPKPLPRCRRLLVLGGALLLLMGGCPVDSDQLIADVVQAALDSATNSFVEALSAFLAGN